jgi:hypothetical protein
MAILGVEPMYRLIKIFYLEITLCFVWGPPLLREEAFTMSGVSISFSTFKQDAKTLSVALVQQ